MTFLVWTLPAFVAIGAIGLGKVGTFPASLLGLVVALAVALTSAPHPFGVEDAALSLARGTGWIVVPYIFAVYCPKGNGPVPALLAASPYRFDNDKLPDIPAFMFRETGPIGFYVEQGYAYVRLDVRGTGRSGGAFEFLGPNEQQDLYDVIEWIAAQPWYTGRVGGIGQSY